MLVSSLITSHGGNSDSAWLIHDLIQLLRKKLAQRLQEAEEHEKR